MTMGARTLPLTPDELLTTTRAVRKRLDLSRPVERAVIEDRIRIAQQAPTGSLTQTWSFVVVTDPATRQALADLYRHGWAWYVKDSPVSYQNRRFDDSTQAELIGRMHGSAQYLAEHLHDVPVHVIPCITPRPDGMSGFSQASYWGCILPAAWSFMLAARARGLGSSWTTLHLRREEEAARLLGIPYDRVQQAALIPVAYTKGTDFKPASRDHVGRIIHWDRW